MTGDIEAAGDAITGAMIARAVEPDQGESQEAGHGACLNCGAALTGPYCAQCGQAAHLHRSFAAIGHDLAHGVLHFEGKLFATLPELALRPGRLTYRYIHGERARFISPFALFLFSALLLYAVFSLTSHHGAIDAGDAVQFDEGERKALQAEQAKADAHIRDLQQRLAAPGVSAAKREALGEELDEARTERSALTLATGLSDSLKADGVNGNIAKSVGGAVDAIAKNPEFAYYKMKANAYKFSWALILISLPFMWLLFPFSRRFKMYDHAIYVTYSIAFMSLLFSLSMILGAAHLSGGLISFVLLLFAAWHMYRQLKEAYALGRTSALLRLPLLYLFASTALLLFFIMLVLMG